MKRLPYDTAVFLRDRVCSDCCCNGDMKSYTGGEVDYFYYCSNKKCKNHEGEGVFQDDPDWLADIEETHNNPDGP